MVTPFAEALFTANALWVLAFGPIAWVSLALMTRFAAKRRGVPLTGDFRWRPSADTRGLSALALWVGLALTGYFFAALINVGSWFQLGIDAPAPPMGLSTLAVLLPADIATAILVVTLVRILAGVRAASDGQAGLIGRELVAAYAIVLAGAIPPALLALLFVGVGSGWFV